MALKILTVSTFLAAITLAVLELSSRESKELKAYHSLIEDCEKTFNGEKCFLAAHIYPEKK